MSDRFFENLIGNRRLKDILEADIAKGRCAHAYILEGPYGSGKHTAALDICAAISCENREDPDSPHPCGECESCRKILSGSSVDVMFVKREEDKASLGVDPIRAVKSSLYQPPNDGERKFYIIPEAELMTIQAQNALLLSLEEPPEYVMFLILCTDASTLLETVRSRAPVLRMEKFSASFIEDELRRRFPSKKPEDEEKIVYASHVSGGSLGYALELYEKGEDELKLYRAAGRLAELMLSGRQSEAMVFIRTEIPDDRRKVCRILSLARNAVRDMLAAKKDGELLFYSEKTIPAISKKISVRKAAAACQALSSAENDISSNCSRLTVLTSLVTGI